MNTQSGNFEKVHSGVIQLESPNPQSDQSKNEYSKVNQSPIQNTKPKKFYFPPNINTVPMCFSNCQIPRSCFIIMIPVVDAIWMIILVLTYFAGTWNRDSTEQYYPWILVILLTPMIIAMIIALICRKSTRKRTRIIQAIIRTIMCLLNIIFFIQDCTRKEKGNVVMGVIGILFMLTQFVWSWAILKGLNIISNFDNGIIKKNLQFPDYGAKQPDVIRV